jgi:hypothetical protein
LSASGNYVSSHRCISGLSPCGSGLRAQLHHHRSFYHTSDFTSTAKSTATRNLTFNVEHYLVTLLFHNTNSNSISPVSIMESSPRRENEHVNNFETLDALAEEAKHWRCKLIFNQANISETEKDEDFDADPVDLCAFLQPPLQNQRNFDLPSKTNYMFPERFKGKEAIPLLKAELKVAAIKCGHNLTVRSSHISIKGETERECVITFCCDHARLVKHGPTKKNSSTDREKPTDSSTDKEQTAPKKQQEKRKYKNSTKRAKNKDTQCQFQFNIFLQKETASKLPSRWFLSTVPSTKKDSHNLHQHHFQLDPDHMHVPIGCMSPDEKELAKNCCQLHFTSSSTSDLVNVRQKDGLYFKASQLTYLSQKERLAYLNLSANATTAEKLVESFEAR